MKRVATLAFTGIFCVLCMFFHAGFAQAESPEFTWLDQTLTIGSVTSNPDNIINDSPETNLYLYVRCECVSGGIEVSAIMENMFYDISLESGADSYPLNGYMPYAMAFNRRNNVFTTAMVQPRFDLFFILPVGTPLESLTLDFAGEKVALASLPQEMFH